MNMPKKPTQHFDVDYPLAPIPSLLHSAWPSALALGLLSTSGAAVAGYSSGSTATQVAPSGTFTVTSTYTYDGNCATRARVRYVSGSCTPTGDTGWQGPTTACSGGGTASRTYTMSAAPTAPCVISADGTDATSHYYQTPYTIKASQTINVTGAPPASKDGGTSFAVAATATSGLAVSVGVSGQCTYSAPNVTITKTSGTCTVTFSQAGNATWAAAANSVYGVTATGLLQTITVTTGAPASAQYLTTFPVAAITNAAPSRAVAISTSGSCSGSGSGSATITMTSGSGVCTVHYNQTDDSPSYAPATEVTSPTTATKRDQTLAFPEQTTLSRLFVASSTFAISPVATSASPNSGNAITYSSLATGICTVAATTVTMQSVGICIIAADQAANANYNAAPQETRNVQLTKALQQITVTTHAPGTKVPSGTFVVAASSFAVVGGAATGLPVRIDGVGSCSGGGNSPVTITMNALATGICTVVYTQGGDINYEPADPVTEYVLADVTGGSGCFGEGTYTSLQFNNTGGYIGWACNGGSYAAPGHSISCSPPIWWNIWPIYQPGWSIQPGIGFKGHVLQTQLNPGKTFQIQKAPGGGDYYNVLNTTDATCLASGNATYESSGTRVGSNSSAGYLVAFQDTATLPSKYCDYTATQTKWKMNISGSYATFETAGYPSWPSPGCMGSDSSLALSRRLIAPGDGNFGHWGDSWVRNALPSCSSGGAKIKCGGYTPPPPDHVRFEFDASKSYVCSAPVTIKLCVNPAPSIGGTDSCTPFSGYAVVKPVVSKGTWGGLTAAPLTGFTGTSSGVSLSHTVVGGSAVSLSYSSPSMVVADTTLECYDTSTNTRVDCAAAFVYKTCPPFDAVEAAAATATNLYTKQAGTAFNFDVVGNPTYTGNVTVSLVDVSAPSSTACSGGTSLASAAFTVPSASAGTNTYAFVGGDAGRKTFNVRYDDAATKVAVRMVDKTSACYSSSDTFSIRPTRLVLASPLAGLTATAGAAFTLTATAKNSSNVTAASYAGTPGVNDAYIYGWDGLSISGLLSGSFDAAAAGVATGNAFGFSGVGAITFPDYTDVKVAYFASSVGDTVFTTPSGDAANGDCVVDSYSAALVGGKYGCNIGSTTLTLPRFIPDHYDVDNRLESLCGGIGGMTYFGQSFKLPPAARVAAMGADGNQLSNLTSTYTTAYKPTFTVEAVDGVTVKASPATVAPVSMALTTPFDWSAVSGSGGLYENADTGLIPRPSIVKPATPPNYEAFGLKTTVTDPDGIKITNCNGAAVAATTSCTSSPTTKMRFGMLKMSNAYGSELLPLYVPVAALYWNVAQSKWITNVDDSCTSLAIATSAARNVAIGNYKAHLTSADITISAATATLSSGIGSIKIEAPGSGKFGSADIALNLNPATTHSDSSCLVWGGGASAPNSTDGATMDYLRGAWCSSSYNKDPHARINFGTAKTPLLYMREKY